jgi:uncharacterized membrane protein required for colicin V production
MGLDLILLVFVLVAAIRGWLKGFVLQAVRLGGLIACVYEASPVRDAVKPHVANYLKGIRPELLDRLLWWAACVVSYVVTVGLATWLVRAYRRRPYGEPDLYRGDQAAGFLLGGAKGLLVAVYLVAGIQNYALGYLKGMAWAEQQAKTSRALVWNEKYQPASRVWSARPVQTFVAYVQKMGLHSPAEPTESAEADPLRTASRPRSPARAHAAPQPSTGLEDALNDAIESLEHDGISGSGSGPK